MLSMRGKTGLTGPVGPQGATGPPGPQGLRGERGRELSGWKIDAKRFTAFPIFENGKIGPPLDLRAVFDAFRREIAGVAEDDVRDPVLQSPTLLQWQAAGN